MTSLPQGPFVGQNWRLNNPDRIACERTLTCIKFYKGQVAEILGPALAAGGQIIIPSGKGTGKTYRLLVDDSSPVLGLGLYLEEIP